MIVLNLDDAGAEIAVQESHDADDKGFTWNTFLPYSTFEHVSPDKLALYVQSQRNMFAAAAGWGVRGTRGITEET